MPQQRSTTPASTRRTADQRRDELVEAAIQVFARTGFHGTAVSAITDQVGITQPYAFSLFRSKRELFIAAVERCMDEFEAACRAAAESAPPGDRFAAIQHAAGSLVTEPHVLAFIMQGFTVSTGEPEIRDVVRRRTARLLDLVQELADVGPEQARGFLAEGLLCMVGTTLGLDRVLPDSVSEHISGRAPDSL